MNIFTKFHKDWTTIGDFLLIANFWASLLIFWAPYTYHSHVRFTRSLYYFYVFLTASIYLKFGGISLMLSGLYSREICSREMVNLMWVRYLLYRDFLAYVFLHPYYLFLSQKHYCYSRLTLWLQIHLMAWQLLVTLCQDLQPQFIKWVKMLEK